MDADDEQVLIRLRRERPNSTSGTMQGLLTCGHFGEAHHDASSTWDFPMEEQDCPQGCGLRYFDIRLQVYLLNDDLENIPCEDLTDVEDR